MSQYPGTPQAAYNSPDPGAFASGKHLIVLRNGQLPNRCVKCNKPADGKPYNKRFYWHHPAWYLLILLALLIYALIALCVRKDMKLVVPMCREHRKKRTINTLIWVGALLLGLVLFIAGAAMESAVILLVGVFLFIGGLIYGVAVSQLITPRYMDDHVGKFTGAGQPYLASLPKWQGRVPG